MTEETEGIKYDADGNAVLDPNIRKHMRELEEQNKALQTQVRVSNLNTICDGLGIPKDGLGKLFRDTYQGEPTLEGVKTVADSYPGLVPVKANGTEGLSQEDLDAQRRINSATDPSQTKDTSDLMQEQIARLKGAKTLEEYEAIENSPEYQSLRNVPITTFQ